MPVVNWSKLGSSRVGPQRRGTRTSQHPRPHRKPGQHPIPQAATATDEKARLLDEPLLTAGNLMRLLNCSRWTLLRYRGRGMPGVPTGHGAGTTYRYQRSAIEK